MSLLDDMAADIAGDDVFYDRESGFALLAVGGPSTTFPIIFDDEYYSTDTGELVFAATQPRGWCRVADAPAVGNTAIINGKTYKLMHAEPNGDGETYLHLKDIS